MLTLLQKLRTISCNLHSNVIVTSNTNVIFTALS